MRNEPARLNRILFDFPYEHAHVGQPGKVG